MKNKQTQPLSKKYPKKKQSNSFQDRGTDVAIIGMACRFPGANHYQEFWENLKQGKSSIREIPPERWDWKEYWGDPRTETNKSNSKWGGFIQDVEAFDPSFFGLSIREVETMDPQQRIMLELSWACLEDAGICPSQISGNKVGVFIGVFNFDYKELQEKEVRPIETYHSTGTASAIIPNRISHYFNLMGPSFPIDTACSSSLNAIHSAVQSLHSGECEMALAGGISLLLTPTRHISFSKTGMLSPTGSCKTFDERADGYVRSEGAGLILLKRLDKAIAEGDSIYGILKGSAVNHNGKTHTLTYPNPEAQAEVIIDAYKRAGITPKSISYIEAHGTGTPKGDPMEFQGLLRAFQFFHSLEEAKPSSKNYCKLGSVKTNIGHLESAAGIAGVIKVLLSMKYKQIPGLQNFQQLNHRISIQDSPFCIADRLQEWKPLETEDNQVLPRRAGVSSFGFGGTNAHILLEEAPVAKGTLNNQLPYYLICLSAKTTKALDQKKHDLLLWLEKEGQPNNLTNISATLLLGREHFKFRAAFVVKDLPELQQKLKGISGVECSTESNPEQKQPSQEHLEELGRQVLNELQSGTKIIAQEYASQLNILAELYENGYDLDWKVIFYDKKIQRLSLPTYPFAKERYWIPEINNLSSSNFATTFLHPLLQQNTSDLLEQRYSSTFSGNEFFLKDHLVKGDRVLPGVAYLEMARAAVEEAARTLTKGPTEIRLKNITWIQPIVVGTEPVQVDIGLYLEDHGEIAFEINNHRETDEAEPIIHCQGRAVFTPATQASTIDLKAIQAQCFETTLLPGQCYEALKAMGIEYGPGHQGIKELFIGNGQILAKLSLPTSVSETQDQFVLHPSLMDAALQATMGYKINRYDANDKKIPGLSLPFALQELEISNHSTPTMWALIRTSEGNPVNDQLQRYDIDISDDQGNVCIRLKGFSSRLLEDKADIKPTSPTFGSFIFKPTWAEQAIHLNAPLPSYEQHIIVLCEPRENILESITTQITGAHCLALQTKQKRIDQRFQIYANQVFEAIQNLLKTKPKGKVLFQLIVFNQAEQQLFAGLSGVLKTAQLENPKFIGQLIEEEPGADGTKIIEHLKENLLTPMEHRIRYQDGKRQITGWSEIRETPAEKIPWKDQGIYLITGGAGGLGRIFAGEIAQNVKNATLILTGRSILQEEEQNQLKELAARGARVEYQPADVTQKKAVIDLLENIQERFGALNGIIHSAGIIQDNYIINKTPAEFQKVLPAKVSGVVHLDQATKDMELDFLILFSSIAGSLGNPGQADYSAANAFMDSYAEYRNALVAAQQRHGQTLSINWPLWKEGGMHVDEATGQMMMQSMGMIPMQTPTGIRALYQSLSTGADQVMVMEGKANQIRQKILSISVPEPAEKFTTTEPAIKINTSSLLGKIQAVLMQTISKILKVKLEDIDIYTELREYGFDSITFTEFNNQLNDQFKLDLNPTIFFEHPTLHRFAEYLIEQYQTELAAYFDLSTNIENPQPDSASQTEAYIPRIRRQTPHPRNLGLPNLPEFNSPEPIAIVGISGIFPMARDVNEFWDNLAEGKDCISEIPKERWDWREYYGDPNKEANKTNIKWGAFIDGIDEFDPLFFGISPREAELMDPQQRLMMTHIWKAIEDAGIATQRLSGTKTGIFVGTLASGYSELISQANVRIEGFTSTGLIPSVGPNRMSYFLNIHGPSEPIETACSSSLVAIHRAVTAIQNGSCEMAIAGGVNTIVTPEFHISFNKAGMLSEDGRCKTFSDRANGYVRGEGVGMLFLKKLKDAAEAGDHIYGIIRGSAENHGGRANSLTAPNPKAQAELLITAYTQAGIDPRTVSYIEAHGTGTELGDPIEINGLKMAFQELYQTTGSSQMTGAHCGLGSVKTNIGHLELAAGIAGVIKVLLQFKHQTLVKSLYSDTLNPYIHLEDSPFYIVREKREWKPLQDASGKALPRRAGVSSFGFGGVNAHVVIEEYIAERAVAHSITSENPAIIVLSAKKEERLKEQAEQLLAVIKKQKFSDADLADMAYTLQVGREPMEERLAIIAKSLQEVQEKLTGFLKNQDGIADLYRGQIKRNNNLTNLATDEEMQETVNKWIQRRKYGQLLELWAKGLNFDWNKLYGETKPRRISLPTYPFARERYWIPEIGSKYGSKTGPAAILHPLVQQNTSDLSEQRYSSTFTGNEDFFSEDQNKGERLLTGMAYVEMARVAVELATGTFNKDQTKIRLTNLIWDQPIVVAEQPLQVHIGLYQEYSGEIAFEIYSQPVVHLQGNAILNPGIKTSTIDIPLIQAQCNQRTISQPEICGTFKQFGLDPDLGEQPIELISIGAGQILIKLSDIKTETDLYVLEPRMLESIIQAAIGLTTKDNPKLALPKTLQGLEIVEKNIPARWILLRFIDGGANGEARPTFDMDIADETGQICARMQGYALNTVNGKEETAVAEPSKVPSDPERLHQKTLHQLKLLFKEITKMNLSNIDADEPFESYGIDSLMINQLNQKLGVVFGELSKTLFYEYQTLSALTDYFVAEFAKQCLAWTKTEERIPIKPEIALSPIEITTVLTSFKSRKQRIRNDANQTTREPLAIIGISGRYPQARTLNEYWDNLASGKDSITEIPEERWPLQGFYQADPHQAAALGKSYSKWGGFLDGFADFDPLFFNISPREALNMDPQERLFIEVCWEALEDAGYTREQLATQYHRKVGVFAGITKTGFELYGPALWKQGEPIKPHTSFSSVANRISYLLNLQGPSMPIDTMCSSSLTAIHEAGEHLQRRECEMAIAGGINLYLHPSSYITLCAQQMLSIDGQCKSFGEGGNGFVPGEGAGAILIKRLSQAIADQDHIYAVIQGTSINHGGKTNGYTVPNPTAQGELIRDAMDKAGIHARTVSYIEAHGTGTELGDPIEITGLTQAFQKYTQDTGYCAIGSVKSNIGHLEAAAGIAGITKIILQMKHQKLAPSLHAKELNHNINFEQTPFVVQQELAEWKRPVVPIDGQIKEYPRRAGISSFGAGGSNAHVIIEEYISDERQTETSITSENPAIIVLSAKNEERLKEQAEQLLAVLKKQEFSDAGLADMAYTLQVGREAMEERLAMVVSSIKELKEKLQGFMEAQETIEDLYRGQAKGNKDTLNVFTNDKELQEAIAKWIQRKKYGKLLELWVKGLNFDWNKLYGEMKPRRLSLPTYPFAKERYWIPEINNLSSSNFATTFLHPLVHQNTSDLSEQRFSSTFTGKEVFFKEYQHKGERIFAGMAYLEMARAAVELATGAFNKDQTKMRLKNLIWDQPIVVVEQPLQVHIGLYQESNGEIGFEIYSQPETDGQPVVHLQGNAILNSGIETPTIDISSIQAQCNQRMISKHEIAETFKQLGLEPDLGEQTIESVSIGQGQILVKLSDIEADTDQFVWHPGLIESAIQAAIGLITKDNPKLSLPRTLQELEIIKKNTPTRWILIRFKEGRAVGESRSQLDIHLYDETGKICARIREYSLNIVNGQVKKLELIKDYGTLMLYPCWKEQAIASEIPIPAYTQHMMIFCEPGKISLDSFQSQMSNVRCLALQSKEKQIDKRFQTYAGQIFAEIQNIFKNKSQGKTLIQIVISTLEPESLFTGLFGILKTAQLENPKFIGQLIEVEPDENFDEMINKLKQNRCSPKDNRIRYQNGKRWVAGWSEIDTFKELADIPWKEQGIYLITGGAGGLGLIFAKEIAAKVKDTTIILTGRSVLGNDKQSQIKTLEKLGARIEYQQMDVTQKKEVEDLFHDIQIKFGNLNGIIHSAGVIHDNYIFKKTNEELLEVLPPKVTGLVNLDQISKDLPLDFFLLFSSLAGSLGSQGQADYSAANAFMDAYAKYRNALVRSKQRYGQTMSINWPLWKEGGMQVDQETEKMIQQNMGMKPMQTATGIRALYQALASHQDQVMVVEGNLLKIRQTLGVNSQQFDITNMNHQAFSINLFDKISKGDLTEEEFENLMLM